MSRKEDLSENRILRERAKKLAKPDPPADDDGKYISTVTFCLAHETYAMELPFIREVHPVREITPLPLTPDFVAGIINVRGQILSVIDIKSFFNLPKEKTGRHHVLIMEDEKMVFGILADRIEGVRRIAVNEIRPVKADPREIRADYVKGVTAEPLVILDAERILKDDSLIVHQEVI